MALSACTNTLCCREKLLNPNGTGKKSDMHYCCIFRSRGAAGAFLCRSKSEQKWRTDRQLVYSPLRLSKTGTNTCALVLDNFPPTTAWIRAYFSVIFHLQVPNPLWDFNYPALISNALHSYCEFGTLFPFSCSFVSVKLPVASKANKSIFSLSC